MHLRSFLRMAAVLAVGTGLQTSGNSSQTTPNSLPKYRSTTRAVVVDVVVAKGDRPIVGMHKQDFQVFEDGKPQAIDFFEEHPANNPPANSAPKPPQMPSGVYTNLPAIAETGSVNVLLLDALNTDEQDQEYVHNEIVKFLKSMQPGTRAAIFTLSSRLRMVQGFTTDSSALKAALNDPKHGIVPEKPYPARSRGDKIDDVKHLDIMLLSSAGGGWNGAVAALQSFQRDFASFQANQRVSMTLEALQTLARFLAGVPGRKNLIWFSSSFPVAMFPRLDQTQRLNQPNTIGVDEYGKQLHQTADLLTTSQIAVYPVDAEGLMSEHIAEADVAHPTDYEGQTDANGTASGAASACMECYLHESGARAEKMITMKQLAQDTGGRAFNTNDLASAAQRAIADGARYYTLIYTPTNQKMDGGYRRIKVKVPDRKYRLEYRRGYYADDAAPAADAKPGESPLHGLMMYGMPDATQILFEARVLPATPQPPAGSPIAGKNSSLAGPTTRYSVSFTIHDLRLDPNADGTHRGKVEIEMLAYDGSGDVVNWSGATWAMNVKPDTLAAIQKSGLLAHSEIDLPSGKDIYLETGVYDWESGSAGTLGIPLLLKSGAASKPSTTEEAK